LRDQPAARERARDRDDGRGAAHRRRPDPDRRGGVEIPERSLMNFFHCRSAATTVQGRRPSNQDAVLDMKFPDGRHVVAVADGMGGHRSGEVASALALEALARELAGGAGLREAVIAANAEVYAE